MYPTKDWPYVASACSLTKETSRWACSDESVYERCDKFLCAAGMAGVTKNEVLDASPPIVPKAEIKSATAFLKKQKPKNVGNAKPDRIAAGRLLRHMARSGKASLVSKRGSEQCYISNSVIAPSLEWPEIEIMKAVLMYVRQYLRTYGPVSEPDIRRYFDVSAGLSKECISALKGLNELVEVKCGTRTGLVALKEDVQELTSESQEGLGITILPRFDTFTLAHADKTWILSKETVSSVFRTAAQVSAIILLDGKVVATWRYEKRGKELTCYVEPLNGQSEQAVKIAMASFEKEAKSMATFLGCTNVSVTLNT